jgi:hypothetical protein
MAHTLHKSVWGASLALHCMPPCQSQSGQTWSVIVIRTLVGPYDHLPTNWFFHREGSWFIYRDFIGKAIMIVQKHHATGLYQSSDITLRSASPLTLVFANGSRCGCRRCLWRRHR